MSGLGTLNKFNVNSWELSASSSDAVTLKFATPDHRSNGSNNTVSPIPSDR